METSFNPWLEIWIRPKTTVRRIVHENPNRSLWLLSAIYGFGSLLNNAQTLALGQKFTALAIFLFAAILSPLWGYVFLSIWSALVYWVGKWFKGSGTFQTVRTAYVWSCVPFIVNVISWIALAFLFGGRLFMLNSGNEELSEALVFVLFVILIVRLCMAIWSLVIYLNALAEVQSYSVLKAIFNVIVASIIIIAASWAIWGLAMYTLNPVK
jgi:Yip1 domain.